MVKAVESVVKACSLSPRADSLMLRLVTFNGRMTEVHGFKPLADCNLGDYEASKIGICIGNTALFDTVLNCVQATTAYAKQLNGQDLEANGIVVIITDGEDNQSSVTPATVKDAVKDALHAEELESMVTILVGVNAGSGLNAYLDRFKNEAGLSQFVSIDDATDRKLAKLAVFVSKSVSAQSQALGTGGPSQAVALTI
jgi:hypothetical protein